MAAYLLSPPGMPWTDANGDPLNGGLIYVYQAGTSTLTDSYPTYADAVARTNPNTNPVVLNATGLPSSGGSTIGIWLASGLYKIIVRNSAGVLIQTQDSVGDNTGTDVLPPNYLAGLDVAVNSTDPDHDVDIASGWARDAADSEDMILLSALTKQIDAPWAVGTNAGGLDTGSLSANTLYFPLQFDARFCFHPPPDFFAQCFYISTGRIAKVQKEVGVLFRYLSAANAQATTTRFIDQLPRLMPFRIFECGPSGF